MSGGRGILMLVELDACTRNSFAGITWPDYLVIVAYFAFVLAVGLFSSWKSNRDSVEGYFLSSRSMSFIPVGKKEPPPELPIGLHGHLCRMS